MNQHFKIIITCRNAEKWITRSIQSAQNQTYTNWQAIIVDDCSTDNTWKIIQEQAKMSNRCLVFQNKYRKYQLHSIVDAVKFIQPKKEDVIITLDGDDWFFDNEVLEYLAKVYKDPNVWITWGSYINSSSRKRGTSACPLPLNWDIRTGSWIFSHLRTFKYFLWQLIKDEDFRTSWSGKYYPAGGDNAFMRPMIEMAGPSHRKFIDRVLYVYNEENPLSVRQVAAKIQPRCSFDVQKKPPYSQIAPSQEFCEKNLGESVNKITAIMTTIPEREDILHKVLNRIYDQVDDIRIVFNKYEKIPSWVTNESKITPFLDSSNRYSDCAKWQIPPKKGYVFSIDDDILYPKNYVKILMNKIEEYHRTCVVTVQGSSFRLPFHDIRKDKKTYHFTRARHKDTSVYMVGTGTLAYHTDTIRPRSSDFLSPSMSDIWFSLICHKKKIPIICILRDKNWLQAIQTKEPTIWDRIKSDVRFRKKNTKYIRKYIIPYARKR